MDETLRRVHFVAICGTGMGSLAGLLHARGIEVSGSDITIKLKLGMLARAAGVDPVRLEGSIRRRIKAALEA